MFKYSMDIRTYVETNFEKHMLKYSMDERVSKHVSKNVC